MKVTPIRTRISLEDENLSEFIQKHVRRLPERSILAVTSKIVSLSEGRARGARDRRAKERLIKSESQWAMRTKYTWLTIKDNTVMASAGVDESNANGKLILLPRESFRSAKRIRKELQKRYKTKHLGVVITDSCLLPLRAGIVGMALGYAGFRGVRDYRGKSDIFRRKLTLSQTDVADSVATAAVLTMGEGAEQQPLALIEDAPVEFTERVSRRELWIDPREDIYQPLFEKIKKITWKKK